MPQLAGKTDLIPNRVNSMWIDPHEAGVYVGQCAQYCGTQHAKMLLRVVVDSPADFERWVADQQPAGCSDRQRGARAARSSRPPPVSTATPLPGTNAKGSSVLT